MKTASWDEVSSRSGCRELVGVDYGTAPCATTILELALTAKLAVITSQRRVIIAVCLGSIGEHVLAVSDSTAVLLADQSRTSR